ncbi:MAG: bifunctional DNA primase/polymerase [Candidatus Paceibacterota bacterium]|jgi:hypothetical protein
MKTKEMLKWALFYRDMGYSVIPVRADKKPILQSWKEYQSRIATEDEIEKWWEQNPDAQIGCVTGAISNLVVIDVEKGGNFEDYPETLIAKTGGDGRHFYFKHPGRIVGNRARIRELTDVRGDGGYVVAPPSVSTKGEYEWLTPVLDTELAEIPAWIMEEEKMEASGQKNSKQDWEQIFSSDVLEGMRNDKATQVAGKLLHDMPEEAWPLGWELFREWNTRLTKPLVEKELRNVWKSISKAEKLSRKKKAEEAPKKVPRTRIAKCPVPEKLITFDEWADTISTNFPDLRFSSEVALSTVAQFLILDITNPFALVLVDVPSSGKTIEINFFADIPELTYATDKFTPASFVSNAANVKKQDLADIDLLPRIQYRMFLIRDLATLFSKREDDLNELLGILTRVLDGEGLNTDSGVHGQREYVGEYLFMMLAASTPIPPRVMKAMGNLGSRLFFLSVNSREKSEGELAAQVVDKSYKKKEHVCRVATRDFLYTLWNAHPQGIEWDNKADNSEIRTIISRCAKLLASLRGVINVWQDDFNNEFKYGTPVIERPDRVNQLFYNLARGHALICGRTQIATEDLAAIIELCVDGAPSGRAKLFRKLTEHGGIMTTSEIEKELNCSKPTALKEMKTLQILGVCTQQEGVREDNEISLSEEFRWFLSEECLSIRGRKYGSQ